MCSGDHGPWGVGEGTHDHALGVSEGHTCGVVCGGQCEAVALEGEVPVGCGDGGAGVGGHVVDDEFNHGAHAESVGDEGGDAVGDQWGCGHGADGGHCGDGA